MGRGTHNRAKGMMGRCRRCGEPFEKKQSHQEYCTTRCGDLDRLEAYRRRYSEGNTQIRIGGKDYELVPKDEVR